MLVSYQPPDLKTVPLREALNRIRAVPAASELLQIARALGIAFGD